MLSKLLLLPKVHFRKDKQASIRKVIMHTFSSEVTTSDFIYVYRTEYACKTIAKKHCNE